MHSSWLSAVSLVAILFVPSAYAQCRASATSCLGSDVGEFEYVTESSFIRTCSTSPSMIVEQDAPAGRVRADKFGPGDGAGSLSWTDDFVVRNAPPGAMTLRARLLVSGWTDTPATNDGDQGGVALLITGIQDGVRDESIWFEPGKGSGRANVPAGTVLEMSIACEVDQPFFLQAMIVAIGLGLGEVHVESRLSFEGLPEGATIESCKGYRQTTAVPAGSASWGRLKATYR